MLRAPLSERFTFFEKGCRVVTAAMPVAFTSSVRIFRCYSMASVVLSRLLLCASMGVVERLVVRCCNPEAMKQHRELPRYGHHRSFVGVLGSPSGYWQSGGDPPR